MKKEMNNTTDINKLTRNIDKQLMQLLRADLNQYKFDRDQAARGGRGKQAA